MAFIEFAFVVALEEVTFENVWKVFLPKAYENELLMRVYFYFILAFRCFYLFLIYLIISYFKLPAIVYKFMLILTHY